MANKNKRAKAMHINIHDYMYLQKTIVNYNWDCKC